MKGKQILSYEVLESCPKDLCLKITFNCPGKQEQIKWVSKETSKIEWKFYVTKGCSI